MATKKRSYNDICGLAHALELVGERWGLLVLRELSHGPKRFTDIRAGLPAASPNVLSQRLRELEATGVILRRRLAPPAGSWVYELTEWGAELEPTMRSFGRWAARSPNFPEEGHMSADSMAMSMETMFVPDAVGGLQGPFELRFGEDTFKIEIKDGMLDVVRGEVPNAVAVIDTEPMTWVRVIYEGVPLDEVEASGDLGVTGDREAVAALAGLFELPEPVELGGVS